MSLDRIHGEVVFTCDPCDEPLETGEDDFDAALAQVKRAGWRFERVGGDWVHTCPGCVQDERKAAFR